MRLDFLVPGFSKCGTTSLCGLLGEHPEIFIPAAKEPCFFAYNYARGWDWYEASFRNADADQICGEGSTFYSTEEYGDIACQRVLDRFPDVRFIFIARHPLRRLESSFREMHHSGYKYGIQADLSIETTLRSLPNMVQDTLFWQRISTFRRYVSDDRIHVLFLEDFRRDPLLELRRCFRFLQVDADVTIPHLTRQLNPGSQKYYDTPLYRALQQLPGVGPTWASLPISFRENLVRRVGLRKPFRGKFEWPAETLSWLLPLLRLEAHDFLQWSGKPVDFWDLNDPDQPLRAAA